MNLKKFFAQIEARNIGPNVGHKKVSAALGEGATTVRYALIAYRTPSLYIAVCRGVVQEAGVVKALRTVPENVARAILALEIKLGRTLSRSRAEKLIAAWHHGRQKDAVKAAIASFQGIGTREVTSSVDIPPVAISHAPKRVQQARPSLH